MRKLFLSLKILTALFVCGCSGQHFSVEDQNSEFGQKADFNTQVDVLWVVDNSGSMTKRFDALVLQIPSFIKGLDATGLDYKIAVTTMDMSGSGSRGHLIAQNGTPISLRSSTPNLVSLLQGRIQSGITGSPVERGREAAVASLRLAKEGGSNSDFFRPGALLNIIFLSDEEDSSDNTVNYSSYFDSVKPALALGDRSWIAHFIGVLPADPDCKTAEWNFSSPGLKYMDLVATSGGSNQSICDADFQKALTNVKARLVEIQTEFRLDRKPVEASIKVHVDGIEVARDPINGWTYQRTTNSIRFHGTSVPTPKSRIAFHFDPDGLK